MLSERMVHWVVPKAIAGNRNTTIVHEELLPLYATVSHAKQQACADLLCLVCAINVRQTDANFVYAILV